MKSTSKLTLLMLALAVVLGMASCSNNQGKDQNNAASKPALPKQENENLTIRYIDGDTLLAQYNLAKDFNEAAITMQNNYDAAQKNQEKAIASLQSEFENKGKSNVYANDPQQYKADQARYQQAVQSAQQKLGQMQQNMAKQAQANQKQVIDSIDNFLKDYAKQKGYDMILNKNSAAFYMDPKYDVTADVVKGLNARYTKVAKKK